MALSRLLTCVCVTAAVLAPITAQAATVKVWTFLDPTNNSGREVAFREIIKGFEASHPGVKIKVEPQVWSQITQKFVLGHNTKNAPDVVFLQNYDLVLVAKSGAAAPLNELVEQTWSAERRSDFLFNNLIKQATFDGKIVALPLFVYSNVLFYRKDLYEAAGIKAADIATWDGFVAASKKVQTSSVKGVVVPLSPDRATQTPAITALLDAQKDLFSNGCKPVFANDAGAKAMLLEAGFYGDGAIASREDLSRNSDDAADVFSAGRAAAYFHTTTRFGFYNSKLNGNVGIAPWPGLSADKPGPTLVSAWQLVAWSGSSSKKEAISFIDYMLSPESVQKWSELGEQPPLLKSVSDKLDGAKFDPLRQVADIIGKTGVMLPAECRTGQLMANFNIAAQKVIVDKIDPIEALKGAEQATANNQ